MEIFTYLKLQMYIVLCFSHIIASLGSGNVCLLSLLDLSAAFDTIHHDILLERLKINFNIHGNVLSWLGSYLKSRTICLKVGTFYNDQVIMPIGLPFFFVWFLNVLVNN